LELPEALDETRVRRKKEEHDLDRLQSSIDSVSDDDDSKEQKAAQDDENLASVSPRKISRIILLTVHLTESMSVGRAAK
jgi:hypothetical protein